MKKVLALFMAFVLLVTLAACSRNVAGSTAQAGEAQSSIATSTTDDIAGDTFPTAAAAESVAEALAENDETHATKDDAFDASAAVAIVLDGDSITAAGSGITVDGRTATITAAGVYRLSGSLADGQIAVDTQDEATVYLILSGVTLHNTTGAPLAVLDAEKVVLVLADGTQNTLSDAETYVFENPEGDEPNAALFSKADLTITGAGALAVNASYNDGIASKDGLVIAGGTITVDAADDGIRGKDYLLVKDGTLTVTAQGDGLKSDNEEDAESGYILIEDGTFHITAGGDALAAQTDVLIAGGTFTLSAGGGSANHVDETTSAKGIKGLANVTIDGGVFTIDAADDALHSNNHITLNGGSFTIASGDDGLHADATLTINGGEMQITRSYEGIESMVITLNAGNLHIVASDDGINVAGGMDGSGMMGPGGRMGGGPGGMNANQDAMAYTGASYLYINGGYIVVDATGDGIDVNGAILMTDGVVLVNGPTEQMNGALDYDAGFNISGGFFVATGSAGMAQAPGAASDQYSTLVYFASTLPAGTLVHIQNGAGEDVLTFAPTKTYQSLVFSSPELIKGGTYTISTGGSAGGTPIDGLYQDGGYTGGTPYENFTISEIVTQIGGGGGGWGGRRP
ncbi:MAG: carbohydrate-binding domain-containing protein [Chloroflexota bacterium]